MKADGLSRGGSVPEESLEERIFDWLKYVVIGVVVLGAVWLILQLILFEDDEREKTQDNPAPEIRTEENAEIPIESLLNPERLRTAFLEASGGEDYLEELKSIKVSGRIEGSEDSRPFFLIKRNPGRSLLKTGTGDGMVAVGTEGKVAWRAFRKNSVYRDVYFLSGDARESAIESSRFFDGLMDLFLNDRGELKRVSTAEIDGEEVIRVETVNEDGEPVDYWLDPNHLDVVRIERTRNGSVWEYRLSDYRKIDKLRQPFRQESWVDGELLSVVLVDEAELNPGVHPYLFKIPETTAPGRLRGGWNMAEEVEERMKAESEAAAGEE